LSNATVFDWERVVDYAKPPRQNYLEPPRAYRSFPLAEFA